MHVVRFLVFLAGGCAVAWAGLAMPPAAWAQAPGGPEQPGPDPIAPELSTQGDAPQQRTATEAERDRILDLDIDQLSKVDVIAPSLDMEVSTVARAESTVGRSPAAVFVITNEMIRRSGARSIPEVLRLAPGVNVARIDAARWAVTIRGFNNRWANKLLVQVDGRTVYTPVFGGVFWEVQNLVLEDVERIEVIRGPGATVWGANAVNGVINILTKHAKDTQGGLYQGGAGTEELGFHTARYGGRIGRDAYYRVYGQWFERDATYRPDRTLRDGTRQAQTGFRCDWRAGCDDAMTVQGDYYNGYNQIPAIVPGSLPPDFAVESPSDDHTLGGNVLARWTRTLDDESDWSLQFFYDRAVRHDLFTPFDLTTDIVDVDFQHRFPLDARNAFIWGWGYRNTEMTAGTSPFNFGYDPPERNDNLVSYFVQDQITLREDRLFLILGSKFEHNDYTGFEYQPCARMLWTPGPRHSLWASISRAVRTPAFADVAVELYKTPSEILPGPLPVFPVLHGDPSVRAEDVLAYETGIRVQPTDAFYWDLATFFNRYENLVAGRLGTPYPGTTPGGWPAGFQPIDAVNRAQGETYGFELAAGHTLNERWRARAAYTFLCMAIRPLDPDVILLNQSGENPRNQFDLWLSGDLGNRWSVDFIGRYVDALPALAVPRYVVMDVRLAWRPRDRVELFLVWRNLLDQSHPEYGSGDVFGESGSEIQQEVHGGVTCRF
ncbi:MAG: TonB-dependent receptor [Pirellulales bacterium]|nr:TonB-dependent receptor [Pirellulales bacterium]